MSLFRIYGVLFCLIVSGFLTIRVNGQYDVTTDLDRCCKRAPNATHADSTCRVTRLSATQFQQSITTPNYPKAFPPDIFCTWEVRAIPGRRILLDFRNMHLAGHVGGECVSQKLIIRSPLTGLSVGPYCGYDGLPNIVSTGNLLIIELQSPSSVNGKEYKGFQLVYTDTVQATTPGLRPPEWSNGMFLESQPTVRTKPSRYKPTPAGKNENTAKSPGVKNPTPPREPKNKTPKEKDRVMSNSNGIWNYPPAVRPYQPPRIPTRTRPEKNESSMGTETIVGIIVGGIIFIAILSIVVAKLSYYRSDKKREKAEQKEEEARNMQAFHQDYQKPIYLPVTLQPPLGYSAPSTKYNKPKVIETNEKVPQHIKSQKRSREPGASNSSKETERMNRHRKRHPTLTEHKRKDKRKTNNDSRKHTHNKDPERRPRSRDLRKKDSKDVKNKKSSSNHKRRKSSTDRRPKRR